MNKPTLILTNTLSRKKEPFAPLKANNVSLYVCGITPYDYSHIGHGRSYVHFDLLVRTLRFFQYNVTYIRNVTDIDDKLLTRAQKEYGSIIDYPEIAKKFTSLYQKEMTMLGCVPPNKEPKATDHIDEIIFFVQKLIEKKCAYVIDNDVYFDTQSFPDYGKLSGKNLDELQAGARIQVDERKKHPADFVLWKGNNQQLFWQSPWGYGRPGWHIECSVMAKRYLGETIDIHGGGIDLIFPHHENEIAQSESLHQKPFARYWLHNELLNLKKEKMSKSLGNIFSLHDTFKKVDPMVLRFYFLQHHYRTPIEFSFEHVENAKTAYKKLINALTQTATPSFSLEQILQEPSTEKMVTAIADDLNSPAMIGIVFQQLDAIKTNPQLAQKTRFLLTELLGLALKPLTPEEHIITPKIEALLKKREQARQEKNWKVADKIRDQLSQIGYEVQDKKIM